MSLSIQGTYSTSAYVLGGRADTMMTVDKLLQLTDAEIENQFFPEGTRVESVTKY
jgi:hypothetical protein